MDVSITQSSGPPDLVTCSFLLSNLHCPSCVSHNQDILSALHPQPSSISPSLVTSWVTVVRNQSLSLRDIQEALEHAGFDVCDVATEVIIAGKLHMECDNEIRYLGRFIDKWRS